MKKSKFSEEQIAYALRVERLRVATTIGRSAADADFMRTLERATGRRIAPAATRADRSRQRRIGSGSSRLSLKHQGSVPQLRWYLDPPVANPPGSAIV